MTRIGLMFLTGAIAVAAFFSVFYLGAVWAAGTTVPLLVALVLGALIFFSFKLKREKRS